MFSDLPPLKALTAFAAVAQTLHVSKAADRLNVSQSAVSHQIKNLEKHLGCQLLYRQGNQLLLTEQGQLLADTVTPALESISATARQLMGQLEPALQFGVVSAFAVHCLTPQLINFSELNQGLDLRLRMLTCDDDISRLDLDLLLLDKPLQHSAYDCEKLKSEAYYPVAVPEIADRVKVFPISQWQRHSRLIDLHDIEGWQYWFEQNDCLVGEADFLRFGNTLLMLQAAKSGQGIALLPETLIKNELSEGSLCKLSDKPLQVEDDGYYFCVHHKRRKDPNVRIVRNWLSTLMV